MEYTTTVINLIGGPGAGKSTMAAELYAKMKRQHMSVEMVREVAKEWVWQGHHIGPFEQLSILGEQIKRESALFNRVKFVVTDSPSMLGAFYCQQYGQKFMSNMVYDYYQYSSNKGIRFLNYMVPRNHVFDTNGRLSTEEESKQIDSQLQDYMNQHEYIFTQFTNPHLTHENILDIIIKDLK